MDKQQITDNLIACLCDEFEVAREKFSADALLKDDLGFDSLDMVDVVVLINQTFGVKLKAEDFVGCQRFGQLVDLLASRVR
ncbi:MAG: acyl carrier protein [Paludibacteraceae bacterium]